MLHPMCMDIAQSLDNFAPLKRNARGQKTSHPAQESFMPYNKLLLSTTSCGTHGICVFEYSTSLAVFAVRRSCHFIFRCFWLMHMETVLAPLLSILLLPTGVCSWQLSWFVTFDDF